MSTASSESARVFLDGVARDVEGALDRWLPGSGAPGRIAEAMRWSVLAPGKRIRPALVLASAEAVGGARESALPAACAVELVHAFSLIHDDLPAMDDDALRRGRAASHVRYGEALAILAGDAVFALAFEILANGASEPGRVPAVVAELGAAVGCHGMIGGQVLDLEAEGHPPDLGRVLEIHRRKTGALMRAACAMGGLAAGAGPEAVGRLRRFGEQVGLAFQITDDLLDLAATQEELGKPVRRDREKGKQTWPAAAGRDAAERRLGELVEEAAALAAPLDRHGRLAALARFVADRRW